MIIVATVVALIIIAVITVSLVLYSINKKYADFVLQNSMCLKRLNEINSRYNFYPYICFDQSHTYDNEKYYNTISCQDYLIYQLQYLRKNISEQIDKINSNKRLFSNYLNEVNAITQFGQFGTPIGKLKLEKLVQTEKQLITKHTSPAPLTQFYLTVTLYRTDLNGQIFETKRESFYADDILTLIKRLNNKRGTFYNDRGIWDALCRVERGNVSNKMRFAIYARDGYRCRKCGTSQNYARLEIDHIIPIAKGGKSTWENLQTLCHNCNVQKGDDLY